MEQIRIRGVFREIASGDLAEFKRLAAELIEAVGDEAGTLQYDWFFNAEQDCCAVDETYASSEAVLAHMGNVGERVGALVGLCGSLEARVYGEPSPALLEAAAAFDLTVYRFFDGK